MVAHKAHCLILPYPFQGHSNPMLQFSKRLEKKGIKITIAMFKFVLNNMQEISSSSPFTFETISDGFDEGGPKQAKSYEEYMEKFRKIGFETLHNLVEKLQSSDQPIDCLVYDAFVPWALDVAKEFGLVGACFFTQSCAVSNIYYHIHNGLLKLPLPQGEKVMVSGLPPLDLDDTPSFVCNPQLYSLVLEMLVNQFMNLEEADWVLFNTFHELEKEVIDWMAKLWPVRAIGPTIPSLYIDKRLSEDKDYGLKLFKPMTIDCMNWLNDQQKPDKSVVYVSFGSLAQLENDQMEELAKGLEKSKRYFLWVVRESEIPKLPKDFAQNTSQKGLIVSWSPQLEVLAHRAVGCFVTHCGWNSILEAMSSGVPMVGMPQFSDQTTNAKFVGDVWGMGMRAKPDERGIARRDEIDYCIREVMEGERRGDLRKNAIKWKGLAREAVDEGGSSDRDIEDFAWSLVHQT